MDIDVTTTMSLYADGRIVLQTHTHEETDLKGGHSGVVALVYASDGGPALWNSTPQRYGVDGKDIPFGQSDRDDTWEQTIDSDTMSQVHNVAIHHFESPNSAAQDVANWLGPASQAMSFVGAAIKAV